MADSGPVKSYAAQILELITTMEQIDGGTFEYLTPAQVLAMNKMKAAFGVPIDLMRVKESKETWRG